MDDITEHIRLDLLPLLGSDTVEALYKDLQAYGTGLLILRIASTGQVAITHLPQDAMWAVPELSASASPHGPSDTPNDTPGKS